MVCCTKNFPFFVNKALVLDSDSVHRNPGRKRQKNIYGVYVSWVLLVDFLNVTWRLNQPLNRSVSREAMSVFLDFKPLI